MSIAFIGFGSNLAIPYQRIKAAIQAFEKNKALCLKAISPWYVSQPVGPVSQPAFLNGVLKIETELSPTQLLTFLQELEQAQGRERTIHWGPRTLDLDLLTFNDLVINTEELVLPHPEMERRAFVLRPLLDLEGPGAYTVSRGEILAQGGLRALRPGDYEQELLDFD